MNELGPVELTKTRWKSWDEKEQSAEIVPTSLQSTPDELRSHVKRAVQVTKYLASSPPNHATTSTRPKHEARLYLIVTFLSLRYARSPHWTSEDVDTIYQTLTAECEYATLAQVSFRLAPWLTYEGMLYTLGFAELVRMRGLLRHVRNGTWKSFEK